MVFILIVSATFTALLYMFFLSYFIFPSPFDTLGGLV
jgi:hypothetical protein